MNKFVSILIAVMVAASAVLAGQDVVVQWEKIIYGTNALTVSWQFPYGRGIVDRVIVGGPLTDTNTVTLAYVLNAGMWTNTVSSSLASTNGAYVTVNPTYQLMENGDTLTLSFSHARTTQLCPWSIWLRDCAR